MWSEIFRKLGPSGVKTRSILMTPANIPELSAIWGEEFCLSGPAELLYASQQVRLLALDPALRNSGYAILEKAGSKVRAVNYGVIRNKAELSMPGCLVEIHRHIEELIRLHSPEECAVEGLIYVQNTRTAITLGAARGSALLAAAQHGLPIYEYPPRRVKQAVVGRGGAQKAQIGYMVRTLLGLTETPEADAADALAIGLTHFQMHSSPLAALRGNHRL